jgi:4-aminobutyrate aminotransferase
MANATERGEQLRAGLRELTKKHSGLSGVRGLGLMTAVDTPSAALREKVIQTAFGRGLLLLGCGETAIRFCPPLCVSAAQVDTALAILDGVLGV